MKPPLLQEVAEGERRLAVADSRAYYARQRRAQCV